MSATETPTLDVPTKPMPETEVAAEPTVAVSTIPVTEPVTEPVAEPVVAVETIPAPEPVAPTADARKSTLDRVLADRGAQGWRIETRSDFQATVAKGKPLNNVLHLILTIVTVGLWGIVWIALAIFGGLQRRMITIDEYGNIIDTKI